MSSARGQQIGITLDLLDWLDGRRAPFGVAEVAAQLEKCQRTAWRYLIALEARGVIELVHKGRFHRSKNGSTRWVSRFRRGVA